MSRKKVYENKGLKSILTTSERLASSGQPLQNVGETLLVNFPNEFYEKCISDILTSLNSGDRAGALAVVLLLNREAGTEPDDVIQDVGMSGKLTSKGFTTWFVKGR